MANSDRIDVVNMSAGFPGFDEGRCGTFDPSNDPLQTAICALEDEDVPFIASAGNDSEDAATQVPAAYDASFTVSAFTDYDGRLGGMGQPLCWPDIGLPDDHIAWFSNFGEDVDIAAPGVCILSTTSGNEAQQYDYNLGTSMAAPHVAGAAALYLASNPGASNASLRRALMRAAVPGPLPGDPDAYPEPLLNVTELP